MKVLKIGKAARLEAVEALTTIANAVGTTLGPTSSPFLFEKRDATGQDRATVSKDGLTVLRSLEFTDPIYNAVHYLAQQASAHTVMSGGDGTTSTIVLASEIARQIVEYDAVNPQAFARRIRKEISASIECIKAEAERGEGMARHVALTSSNGDIELTDIVMEAISHASAYGTIIAEKCPLQKEKYILSRQDGFAGAKGYIEDKITHVMAGSVDDAANSDGTIELHNPTVICFNGNLVSHTQMNPILQAWINSPKSTSPTAIVLVAYEFHNEIINACIQKNREWASKNQPLRLICLKPMLSAEMNSQLQYMRDIASITGCEILDAGSLNAVNVSHLGTCKKIAVSTHRSIFYGRAPNHWIPKRVEQNETLIQNSNLEFDKEIAKIRNAELSGGLVRIKIGGGLMADIQERADRFDDASKAAQACLRSGALPGAGVSYIRAGELAGVSNAVRAALTIINTTLKGNFGIEDNSPDYLEQGQTLRMGDNDQDVEITYGNFKDLNVVDSAETIYAVLRNATELGVTVATLGGFSLMSNLEDFDKVKLVKSAMGSIQ